MMDNAIKVYLMLLSTMGFIVAYPNSVKDSILCREGNLETSYKKPMVLQSSYKTTSNYAGSARLALLAHPQRKASLALQHHF